MLVLISDATLTHVGPKSLTNQLEAIVDDVNTPDLVSNLTNADGDTVRFDGSTCALYDSVQRHTLGTKRQR